MATPYEQLRDRIDTYSVGFCAAPSGIELKILERLFSPAEAEVYLAMTRNLEPPAAIAARLNRPEPEVAEILAAMTAKGLTFPASRRGRKYYAAAPFMHGFFEHQFFSNARGLDLAQMYEEYLNTAFIPKTYTLRTVPIQIDASQDRPVAPYDDIKRIILSKERIGVFPCACNYQTATVGMACARPHDKCLAFDFYAEYPILELGIGRWITQATALDILDQAEEAGLVHQTGGDRRNTECICNCCPECCTVLRKLKPLPNPSALIGSNYTATVNNEPCTLCGTCLGRCPMAALAVVAEAISIAPGRCIGCGLCTSTCPSGALTLVAKPEELRRRPPRNYTFMRSSLDYYADLEED